jgi:signal transduction histidine kinase
MPDVVPLSPEAQALAELARFPEMNPGPVLRTRLDGEVVLANAAARALLGENLVGTNWRGECPGLDDPLWSRILSTDAPVPVEARIGGREFVFAHRRDVAGDLVFIFGSDLTSQKQAERALAEVARFPEMNPGPVLRMRTDGEVILANAAARTVFGEEIVGRRWSEVCEAVTDASWESALAATTDPFYLEARIAGREFVFAHRREVGGQLVFVFGADVTQQKLAERALLQTEKMATLGTLAAGVAHELNNPAAATRRAAEQLREAFVRLEEAHLELSAADIGEEGRELLLVIGQQARASAGVTSDLGALARGDLETEVEDWLDAHGIEDGWDLAPALVGQGMSPGDLDRFRGVLGPDAFPAALRWAARAFPVHSLLREIGEGSSRISELVGALKSYSYLGQAPVQEVDLHEGLDNTLVILRHKLKSGIDVRREYAPGMPPVPAYGSELNQVWTNLLDNAADAMDGKGQVTIRTRQAGGWAVVEVEDDGPGIPAEVQSRIFDPFFTTKAPGHGTGLGLSTSYSIITEKHGGTIAVESRPGLSRFTVRLPLVARPTGG